MADGTAAIKRDVPGPHAAPLLLQSLACARAAGTGVDLQLLVRLLCPLAPKVMGCDDAAACAMLAVPGSPNCSWCELVLPWAWTGVEGQSPEMMDGKRISYMSWPSPSSLRALDEAVPASPPALPD